MMSPYIIWLCNLKFLLFSCCSKPPLVWLHTVTLLSMTFLSCGNLVEGIRESPRVPLIPQEIGVAIDNDLKTMISNGNGMIQTCKRKIHQLVLQVRSLSVKISDKWIIRQYETFFHSLIIMIILGATVGTIMPYQLQDWYTQLYN